MKYLNVFICMCITVLTATGKEVIADRSECPPQPLCQREGSMLTELSCWTFARHQENKIIVRTDVSKLFQQVKGQKEAVETLTGLVYRKLADPRTSFVVHLAGDNGVGKTWITQLLSTALALRPHKTQPQAGDVLLLIHGSAYKHISSGDDEQIAIAAAAISTLIIEHIRVYNTCSVIVLDEFTLLNPKLVGALSSVLGAIEHGGVKDGVDFTGVYLFLTSDFGSDGMTIGKTSNDVLSQVTSRLHPWLQELNQSVHSMVTVPFVAFTWHAFRDAIDHKLRTFNCHFPEIRSFSYDDAVVSFLVDRAATGISKRNAREVDNVIDEHVTGPYGHKVEALLLEERRAVEEAKRTSWMASVKSKFSSTTIGPDCLDVVAALSDDMSSVEVNVKNACSSFLPTEEI
eukprot:PhF_6_TR25256/c0_g1_i6/m.34784